MLQSSFLSHKKQSCYTSFENKLDSVFDAIMALATTHCESAFAQINIIDKRWCTSPKGSAIDLIGDTTDIIELIKSQQAFFEVFDLNKDNRFNEDELVVDGQNIRHYVGLPLVMPDGSVIGTLCIMDTRSKVLAEHQKAIITLLARDIVSQIALLAKDDELEKNIVAKDTQYKELDEFTYIVTHDLKSPLNAINNLVSWIEEDMDNGVSQDTPKYFSMIKNSTERIDRLLKGLSCYSKAGRDEGLPEPLNLKEIVDECCEFLGTTKNFDFRVDNCEVELPKVSFLLVLQHLISNAVKHHHKSSGVIHIACLADIHCYQFSISDDGPGIAAQLHNKIFLPFQTLKSKDEMESNGLGLAMIKKTLGRYEGNIIVKSEEGAGASFIVTWPKNNADGTNIA